MKVSKPLSASEHPLKLSPITVSSNNSNHSSNHSDRDRDRDRERATDDEDQSPPMSPLRLPQLSSSSSSIYSWSSSQGSGHISSGDDDSQPLCNSKEDRSNYNTKFAKYHLETYKKNDRIRWNFDFDHNRPLGDSNHNHHQTVARYQWKPDI